MATGTGVTYHLTLVISNGVFWGAEGTYTQAILASEGGRVTDDAVHW